MGATRNSRGLTLVEVLMAMAISFIVFLGITDTILVALNENIRNAMRDEGVRVAEDEMNTVRALPYDNVVVPSALLPLTDNVSRNYRHLAWRYTVSRRVTDAGSDMKQVVITVFWTRGTRTDNTTFTTIVRKR